MIYLSASSIKDFIACEMKYDFRRLKFEESAKTEPLVIGSLVHEAIEKHWDNHDRAEQYVKNQFKLYNLTSKGKSKVLICLDNFFFNFSHLLSKEDEIEKFFKIKYSKDVIITGKIDRIISGHFVFDWKTTTKPPRDISNDAQFILYYNAYKELYKVFPSSVFYASLTTGKLIKYEENKLFTDKLYNEVIPKMIKTIRENSFVHTGLFGYNICNNCVFKDYCYAHLEK